MEERQALNQFECMCIGMHVYICVLCRKFVYHLKTFHTSCEHMGHIDNCTCIPDVNTA